MSPNAQASSRRPAARTTSSAVNAAAVTGRLSANPPRAPESALWYSDREIGTRRSRVALAYSADDFRRELARVERRLYVLSCAAIVLALIAVVVSVAFILL